MNFRIIGAFSALLLLSACGSVDSAMTYVGLGEDPATTFPGDTGQPPAQTVASVTPDATWCGQIAADEKHKAEMNGFDLATQQKMTVSAYKQCMMMSGH